MPHDVELDGFPKNRSLFPSPQGRSILPLACAAPLARNPRGFYRIVISGLLFLLGTTYFLYHRNSHLIQWTSPQKDTACTQDCDLDTPPKYLDVKEWQQNLPQNNQSLTFPEGSNGRYVKFTCQVHMLGWNNAMNEYLMNSYLAYRSNRAYVFSDYLWKEEYYPWSYKKAWTKPARTPLPALISGPSAGGPWEVGDQAPRSISSAQYNIVCPKEKRKIINTGDVKPKYRLQEKNGKEIFEVWRKILEEEEAPCVEVFPADRKDDGFPQVFDLWLWGSSRVLSLWEEFKDSPVSRLLGTSPVVQRAINRNEWLFHTPTNSQTEPFPRVLAIHLRRGDYSTACIDLAKYKSTFYSWNLLPFLPDRFESPPGGEEGNNTPENVKIYMEHCLPNDDKLVKKIADARDDWEKEVFGSELPKRYLNVLYLMTNDATPWITNLKERLRKEQGWELVRTSREIVFGDAQEKDVGMAVDMEIGRKSAIFIGNGFSSFTSNILYRRLVDGKIPISNRFY